MMMIVHGRHVKVDIRRIVITKSIIQQVQHILVNVIPNAQTQQNTVKIITVVPMKSEKLKVIVYM